MLKSRTRWVVWACLGMVAGTAASAVGAQVRVILKDRAEISTPLLHELAHDTKNREAVIFRNGQWETLGHTTVQPLAGEVLPDYSVAWPYGALTVQPGVVVFKNGETRTNSVPLVRDVSNSQLVT